MNATIAVQSGMPTVTLDSDDFCHDLIVNRREASDDIFEPGGFSVYFAYAWRAFRKSSESALNAPESPGSIKRVIKDDHDELRLASVWKPPMQLQFLKAHGTEGVAVGALAQEQASNRRGLAKSWAVVRAPMCCSTATAQNGWADEYCND